MKRATRRVTLWLATLGTFALVAVPTQPLAAEATFRPDAEAFEGPTVDPDFLFSRPSFSLGLRGGLFRHGGAGDFIPLDGSGFRAVSLGSEVAVWLGQRFELTFGLDMSRFTRQSEYRDFEEVDNGEPVPIAQTTQFRAGPAGTLGLRGYLQPRGEGLSRLIWIPRDWNLFAGAGVGVTGYRLKQSGDLVHLQSLVIFEGEVDSDGYATLAFLDAGTEVGLTPRSTVVLEARYQWADVTPSGDASEFGFADLSGTRFTAGIRYRF